MGAVYKRVPRTDGAGWKVAPWYIRFRGPDGQLIAESTKQTSEKAAKIKLAEREKAVRDGTLASGGSMLLAEWGKRWLDDYSAVRLRAHDDNVCRFNLHVLPVLGALRLRDIQATHIVSLVASLKRKGLADGTVRRVVALVRKILNDAVQARLLHESPLRRLRREDVPREPKQHDFQFFTVPEIVKVLEGAPPHDRAMLATAFYAGLRLGELAGLRWQDVDFDAGIIRVIRSYANASTKDKEPRRVPVSAKLGPVLRAWSANCPKTTEGLCFPDPLSGGMRDRFATTKRFGKLCEQVGIRRLNFHATRHSFASHYVMQGGSVYVLRDLLGHSTVELTARYAHLAPGWGRADLDRLDFEPHRAEVVALDEQRRKRAAGAEGDVVGDVAVVKSVVTGTSGDLLLDAQVCGTIGCGRRDSNSRPSDSKSGALSS